MVNSNNFKEQIILKNYSEKKFNLRFIYMFDLSRLFSWLLIIVNIIDHNFKWLEVVMRFVGDELGIPPFEIDALTDDIYYAVFLLLYLSKIYLYLHS